jgi:hypothetical protein
MVWTHVTDLKESLFSRQGNKIRLSESVRLDFEKTTQGYGHLNII